MNKNDFIYNFQDIIKSQQSIIISPQQKQIITIKIDFKQNIQNQNEKSKFLSGMFKNSFQNDKIDEYFDQIISLFDPTQLTIQYYVTNKHQYWNKFQIQMSKGEEENKKIKQIKFRNYYFYPMINSFIHRNSKFIKSCMDYANNKFDEIYENSNRDGGEQLKTHFLIFIKKIIFIGYSPNNLLSQYGQYQKKIKKVQLDQDIEYILQSKNLENLNYDDIFNNDARRGFFINSVEYIMDMFGQITEFKDDLGQYRGFKFLNFIKWQYSEKNIQKIQLNKFFDQILINFLIQDQEQKIQMLNDINNIIDQQPSSEDDKNNLENTLIQGIDKGKKQIGKQQNKKEQEIKKSNSIKQQQKNEQVSSQDEINHPDMIQIQQGIKELDQEQFDINKNKKIMEKSYQKNPQDKQKEQQDKSLDNKQLKQPQISNNPFRDIEEQQEYHDRYLPFQQQDNNYLLIQDTNKIDLHEQNNNIFKVIRQQFQQQDFFNQKQYEVLREDQREFHKAIMEMANKQNKTIQQQFDALFQNQDEQKKTLQQQKQQIQDLSSIQLRGPQESRRKMSVQHFQIYNQNISRAQVVEKSQQTKRKIIKIKLFKSEIQKKFKELEKQYNQILQFSNQQL